MAMAYTFPAYHSSNAYELSLWAQQENNRIKASKIQMAADRVEARRRKYLMPSGVKELPHPAYWPTPPP